MPIWNPVSGSVLQNSRENARRKRRFNSGSEGIRSARCNIDRQSQFDGNVSRDFMKLREISPQHFLFFEAFSNYLPRICDIYYFFHYTV
jgi:hypothetical protein